ncbi:hypothetical protein D3C72_1179270 [compost metagenome]
MKHSLTKSENISSTEKLIIVPLISCVNSSQFIVFTSYIPFKYKALSSLVPYFEFVIPPVETNMNCVSLLSTSV